MKDDTTENKVHLIRAGFVLHPELLHKEGPATRSQIRESTRIQRVPHSKSVSKEVLQKEIWQHPRPIHPRQVIQKNDGWVGSLWRDHPWDGSVCKRKPQSYCHQSRNWRPLWWLVDSLERGEFRHDADKASIWLQKCIVDIVPPKESGGQEAIWKVRTVPLHGGNGNQTGGIPIVRLHHKDGLNTDRTGNPVHSVNQLFICGMNLSKNLMHKIFIVIKSATVNAVYCHRRGV